MNTLDKIFLLSHTDSVEKISKRGFTYYAVAQGSEGGYWWLRSPSTEVYKERIGFSVKIVNSSTIDYDISTTSCIGVLPAITVNLP